MQILVLSSQSLPANTAHAPVLFSLAFRPFSILDPGLDLLRPPLGLPPSPHFPLHHA